MLNRELGGINVRYGEATPKVKEEIQRLWQGWSVEVGSFGYIQLLEKLGMDTQAIRLSEIGIVTKTDEILHAKGEFDPAEFAVRMLNVDPTSQFPPPEFF